MNPKKYKGPLSMLIYRSLLERRFMRFCDEHSSVLEWSYETVVVPYISDVDGKAHRYFVDFWVRRVDKDGNIRESLVEIKPATETVEPKLTPRKPKRRYLKECLTWSKNSAKWKAATAFAKKQGMEFQVITDKDLKR